MVQEIRLIDEHQKEHDFFLLLNYTCEFYHDRHSGKLEKILRPFCTASSTDGQTSEKESQRMIRFGFSVTLFETLVMLKNLEASYSGFCYTNRMDRFLKLFEVMGCAKINFGHYSLQHSVNYSSDINKSNRKQISKSNISKTAAIFEK